MKTPWIGRREMVAALVAVSLMAVGQPLLSGAANLGAAEASISVADTFFITCALLYGPAAAAAAIATDSLVLSLLRRRHGVERGLFNTLGPTLGALLMTVPPSSVVEP